MAQAAQSEHALDARASESAPVVIVTSEHVGDVDATVSLPTTDALITAHLLHADMDKHLVHAPKEESKVEMENLPLLPKLQPTAIIADNSTQVPSENVTIESVASTEKKEGSTAEVLPTITLEVPTMVSQSKRSTLYNKKYLGGYRDKRTQVEYFHAATQTMTAMEKRLLTVSTQYHRDTQTKEIRNRLAQTRKEAATQMDKRGVYISEENDRELGSQPYFTAAEKEALIMKSAITMQCFFRTLLAKRRVQRLREARDTRLRIQAEKEQRRRERSEKKRRRDIERRVHPKTKKDFEQLYSGLETWRVNNTDTINAAGHDEATRLEKLTELLNQEAILIQKIEGLKLTAAEEHREKAIERKLLRMAGPKKWPLIRGGFALVETPSTLRAKELSDLYTALRRVSESVDERLKLLVRLKYTVKEFDHPLTREIVGLVEREGDMLSRGRDESGMSGLRQRISSLVLQFIETPDFNPEATVSGLTNAASTEVMYLCNSCCKYLSSTKFYLNAANASALKRCRNCLDQGNVAIHRHSDTEYTRIISHLRLQEAQASSLPTIGEADRPMIVNALNETAVKHLIDIIWNGQSAVSGVRDLEKLVLTRWNPIEEFAPWNCILLTADEATTHERCGGPSIYGEEFVRRVTGRLYVAHKKFEQLATDQEAALRRINVPS